MRAARLLRVSLAALGLSLFASKAPAAVRSTHLLLDHEALLRARSFSGAVSSLPSGPLSVVEAPFAFTAVAALMNPGSDGALFVRTSADGKAWSAESLLPDDASNQGLDERGHAHPFALDRVSALHFPRRERGGNPRFLAFGFRDATNPPSRVAFHFIDAGLSPEPPARSQAIKRAPAADAPQPGAHPLKPALVLRHQWGARPPKYAYTLTVADHLAVHHTAGVGDGLAATTDECAAQARAIQVFHQDSRGWNDVGYSYLICGTGEVFQAREDDDDMTDVWGAHDGFNRGSMSVSLMGYFHPPYNQSPTRAMLDSLVRTLAWMAAIRGVDPRGESLYEAFGEVRTNIYGHREVRATECPGDTIFAMKDTLRSAVAETLELFRSPASPGSR